MMRSETDPLTGGRAADGGRAIPVPQEPQEPVLGGHASSGQPMKSVLDVGAAVFPLAGRHAIALALMEAGIGAGDRVLVPAYHCQAMIDPVLRLGAVPVVFPLADGLAVDLDLLAPASGSAKAVLAVHYFGSVQDFSALAAFCRERGILFIEDCAHCFFGEAGGLPVGSFGDYAIASLRKFFPLREGAVLVSAHRGLSSIGLQKQPSRAVVKSIYNMLENATAHGRMGLARPVIGAIEAARSRPGAPQPAGPGAPQGDEPSADRAQGIFADTMGHMALPGALQIMARRFAQGQSPGTRRANFERLSAGISDIPGCRPLALAGEVQAPYLCPIWMDDLVHIFPRLEDAALPMQRFGQFPWAGMDMKAHPHTRALAAHVVQFSCHQSLTAGDIDCMIDRIRTATRKSGD